MTSSEITDRALALVEELRRENTELRAQVRIVEALGPLVDRLLQRLGEREAAVLLAGGGTPRICARCRGIHHEAGDRCAGCTTERAAAAAATRG